MTPRRAIGIRSQTDAQRRAMFANMQRGRNPQNQARRDALGFAGAVIGAGLGFQYGRKALFAASMAGLKVADKYLRGSVHPLKLFRAANKMYPLQRGTYRVIRQSGVDGPAAISVAGALKDEGKQQLRDFVNKMAPGTRRLRVVMAPLPGGSYMAPTHMTSKSVGPVRRQVVKGWLGSRRAPSTTGPAIAHELGHLRPGNLGDSPSIAVTDKGVSNARMAEEFLAHVHGYKIWRKAGGRRSTFIASAIPPMGTYAANYKHARAIATGTGAIIGAGIGRRRNARSSF